MGTVPPPAAERQPTKPPVPGAVGARGARGPVRGSYEALAGTRPSRRAATLE